MRKSTLAWFFWLAYGVVWIFLTTTFKPSDLGLTRWLGTILWLLASLPVSFAILLALSQIQKRLLAWRKARGRDIEDEERYESDQVDHGMISLSPRQEESSKNELEE